MTETQTRTPALLSPSTPTGNAVQADEKDGYSPLRHAVAQHIETLQRDYCKNRSYAVRTLAQLRRGIGRQATELSELWGLLGIEEFHAKRLARGQAPASEAVAERAERAAHIAVTLWALHQQSERTAVTHRSDGTSVGAAVRRLMSGAESDEGIRKRFVRAGSASTLAVMAQRLRELVVLFRANEIPVPLDYGLLAEQLEEWQRPGGPARIRQAWGRGFHAYRAPKSGSLPTEPLPQAQTETTTNEMKEDE
ncbi:type I-E CRISPR-associated protein Cse2/CasB [Streptomyces sp. H27-H1]|uniref:type I-E CRISPR-associated protein Cse2/CasB n=1 Tax=Streptomyces sp. H27-H1 TaxID=2996461 RepID=UPI00226F4678|nr:type I-E CRISPR-associated protein Cse2/CasB [Streptomyces sp. H27-H1]MCY0931659.1 type I-E CRISPR-associated protein Cse2/CasB [Streptomyces sp. H27-H1]